MELVRAVPALRRHPLLRSKSISLVGVSTIVRDESAVYFEIGKPKYWRERDDGTTVVGIGGIGGAIERGESAEACLRREVEEELGARVWLEVSPQTFLVIDWQVAGRIAIAATKKRLPPLMVILVPPRLGGPGTPDHLAIVTYRTHLRSVPTARDLFGLLRIEGEALASFFERDEMPLAEAQAHSDVTVTLNGDPPDRAVLRPVLTGRAFQILMRAGCYVPVV
jgi:8-oxo-dGTP pyrophosphatase MutT (NUDIX family)